MRLTPRRWLFWIGISTLPLTAAAATTSAAERPRVVVLSDIEADPDDTQSFVRLMLYSNQIELQGLIATTSTHMRDVVHPESIARVVRAYGQVQPNLLRHEAGFPEAAALLALVKRGLPVYGMAGVGEGKDSEGSEWLLRVLERDDPRPLWVPVWGGANTLAQSLHKLRTTKPAAEVARLVAKLRVYTISDQDDSGTWIRRNFPDLFYIVSPGGYGAGTWTGIHEVVPGLDNSTVSNAWLAAHIQQGHGPLGAQYPDVAYGMEGDTPSFLGLIPNGLNAPEHPEWGGWGGRYVRYTPERAATEPDGFTGGVPVDQETRPIWSNAVDTYAPAVAGEFGRATKAGEKTFTGFKVTLWRWRDDFQNDFAARMAWSTADYAHANHPPVPVVDNEGVLTVRSGGAIYLDALGSSDPDGDSFSYYWFEYPEAGSGGGKLTFNSAENLVRVSLIAPKVTKPETAHVILKLTDRGSPPLTRYKRVIVTIVPE